MSVLKTRTADLVAWTMLALLAMWLWPGVWQFFTGR
jgi:hypothetical protein